VAEVSKITESARGAMCTIRLPGVCNFDPATTVWCHGNGSAAGKGMWMKAHDLLGAYGCSACHDVYDRRRRAPAEMSREYVELCFWEGHARSIVQLVEKGLIAMVRGVAQVTA
jgi:hypothetical protein